MSRGRARPPPSLAHCSFATPPSHPARMFVCAFMVGCACVVYVCLCAVCQCAVWCIVLCCVVCWCEANEQRPVHPPPSLAHFSVATPLLSPRPHVCVCVHGWMCLRGVCVSMCCVSVCCVMCCVVLCVDVRRMSRGRCTHLLPLPIAQSSRPSSPPCVRAQCKEKNTWCEGANNVPLSLC